MSQSSYQEFLKTSQLTGGNFSYLEELYEDYLADPNSVSKQWQDYFAKLPSTGNQEIPLTAVREYFLNLPKQSVSVVAAAPVAQSAKEYAVYDLISNYRAIGHRQAHLDPLNLAKIPVVPELQLANNGLSEADLNTEFTTGNFAGLKRGTLKDIIAGLEKTYCSSIGAEIMHLSDTTQRNWLLQHYETLMNNRPFSVETKLQILQRLVAAEGFERYLHNKYVGQKRFSLEGGDTLIPMLDDLVERAAAAKVEEITIGMAHRGRLNVWINVMGQAPQVLFDKFDGKHDDHVSGDVKYHLGFSSDVKTATNPIHLALAFNPSHLEIVSPVVEGMTRAKQDRCDANGTQRVVPLLIHGDASFAGQGVSMETFNLSQVNGYKTGGTIHLVINNQVGFTTDPIDDRSTLYCTDIAKMVDAPIFHVNGDDPEAAVLVMQLAFDFRMKFNRDVVIDLVCYRRHGHNEADEPSATQPLIYKVIKSLATTSTLYAQKLTQQNVVTAEQVETMRADYNQHLAKGDTIVPMAQVKPRSFSADWSVYDIHAPIAATTKIAKKTLQELAVKAATVAPNFTLHSRIAKIMEARVEMANGKTPLDWGFAETLAYATLLAEGHNVRISGQDAQRGTFFHRHAVLHNTETGEKFMPLRQIAAKQGRIDVINSTLSEEAVMAFDAGYAMSSPNDLVIWEAQFGDFANGAQVIADQFLSSMEQKWERYCGLVLLLPHGQEGQGPEHSSARLERYLQLCAQNNMIVCQPTLPSQTFHMLRRQVLMKTRKPLIVMTPKSLLRHKLVISSLEDLAQGQFQELIPEIEALPADSISKVIVCSGKVYFDLLEKRQANAQKNVAIIRIEQLYPFPLAALTEQLKLYKNAKTVVWCQEEPQNQGAWYVVRHYLEAALVKQQTLNYVGRDELAAPACGYLNVFNETQEKLINEALK